MKYKLVCLALVCCFILFVTSNFAQEKSSSDEPAAVIRLIPEGDFKALKCVKLGEVYSSLLYGDLLKHFSTLEMVRGRTLERFDEFSIPAGRAWYLRLYDEDAKFDKLSYYGGPEDPGKLMEFLRTEWYVEISKSKNGRRYQVDHVGTGFLPVGDGIFIGEESYIENVIDVEVGREPALFESAELEPLLELVNLDSQILFLRWGGFEPSLHAAELALAGNLGEGAKEAIGGISAYGVSLRWTEGLEVCLRFLCNSEEAARMLKQAAEKEAKNLFRRYGHKVLERCLQLLDFQIVRSLGVSPGESGLLGSSAALANNGAVVELRFAADLETLKKILKAGSFSPEEKVFLRACSIDVAPDGTVYALNDDGRIYRFTADGKLLDGWDFVTDEDRKLLDMEIKGGIAVARDSSVFVADYFSGNILKFSPYNRLEDDWVGKNIDIPKLSRPRSIAIGPHGNLYVADTNKHRILVLEPDGRLVRSFDCNTGGTFHHSFPYGIAVAGDGSIYAVDHWNNRIQHFDSTGRLIRMWGKKGDYEGQFRSPYGIAVGNDGHVYVADTGNRRIQVFTSDGIFLSEWGERGYQEGKLKWPTDIAFASDGSVYVSELRIQQFTLAGRLLRSWQTKLGSLF